MKTILVTQRVVIDEHYNERRDSLDQQWIVLLLEAGFIPQLVPNNISWLQQYLSIQAFDGILLTGGNSLVKYGGNANERDDVEFNLVQYAIDHKLPLLGVCRGMQVLQDYFGSTLQRVEHHVTKRQKILIEGKESWVNSFHEWGALDAPSCFDTWAIASDRVIKAMKHKSHTLYGIMWHPERIQPFSQRDILLLQHIFNHRANIA